jgi:hypothetical protein
LQRLFTMFPSGWPGVALLLVRVAVGLVTILVVCRPLPAAPTWSFVVALAIALGLSLGIFTPFVAVACLLVQFACWAIVGGDLLLRLVALLVTIALVLLGPGAYSIDARWFGRQLVTFPPEDTPPES